MSSGLVAMQALPLIRLILCMHYRAPFDVVCVLEYNYSVVLSNGKDSILGHDYGAVCNHVMEAICDGVMNSHMQIHIVFLSGGREFQASVNQAGTVF